MLDAGVEGFDGGAPPEAGRFLGVWRFHTVRALCDTLAVAFCETGVLVRLSTDDFCDGANPTDPAPSVAAVEWLGPREARLSTTVAERPATIHFRLIEAPDRRDDRLELIAIDGPVGFPWEDAVRDEAAREPLPPEFIGCE